MTLVEILCKYTWKWAAGGGAEGAQARGVAVERAGCPKWRQTCASLGGVARRLGDNRLCPFALMVLCILSCNMLVTWHVAQRGYHCIPKTKLISAQNVQDTHFIL